MDVDDHSRASTASGDPLATLYEKYNALLDAKDVSVLTSEFSYAISCSKGIDKEKLLASQIICKFIKHFPKMQVSAVNSLIDLCEDDSDIIRISAIKHIAVICKECPELIPRLVDILTQLVGLFTGKDYNLTCSCLSQVFNEHPVVTAKTMLNQIKICTDDSERIKMTQFLYKTALKVDLQNTEFHNLLIEQGKLLLEESSGEEFLGIMSFLAKSKLAKTISGQQELVDYAVKRAKINKNFNLEEEEVYALDRIIMCIQSVINFFSANISSDSVVVYFCSEILPQWDAIGQLGNGEVYQCQFVQILAELTMHCGTLEEPVPMVQNVFDVLKMHMPLPPEDPNVKELPNLDFTNVECLLFTFHKLVRQCPDFLSPPAVIKDFKMRLSYFARGVGGCRRAMELAGPSNISKDEKLKIAPLLLSNITLLIKDLFHVPPNFKCNITLSFKQVVKDASKEATATSPSNSQTPEGRPAPKRHAPIRYQNSYQGKRSRTSRDADEVKLYSPPSGKFSKNSYHQNNTRFFNRGRGHSRTWVNRGGSRKWGN